MNPTQRAVLLLCFLSSSPLSAQQVWKVFCNGGPGVHFTDLPPAVAAAAPGDEIWVWYDITNLCQQGVPYTAAVITKPLKIIGFEIGTSAPAGPSSASFKGYFVILGIPAGQRVVLSNVEAIQLGNAPWTDGGLVAVDCAGDILLEDVTYNSVGHPGGYWHFERCNNVVMRGCFLNLAGAPIRVIDSTLLMSTTSVRFNAPTVPLFGYQVTTEGLRVINSTVTMVNSFVFGNDQYYSHISPYWPLPNMYA